MRQFTWMFAGALALVSTAALSADPASRDATAADSAAWSRFQGRLSLGTAAAPWRPGADSAAAKLWWQERAPALRAAKRVSNSLVPGTSMTVDLYGRDVRKS